MTDERYKLKEIMETAKQLRDSINHKKVQGQDYAELTLMREIFGLWKNGDLKLKANQMALVKSRSAAKLRGKLKPYAEEAIEAMCSNLIAADVKLAELKTVPSIAKTAAEDLDDEIANFGVNK
jgi:hypothetical protein